jgi:hypothetical protein
VCPALLPPGKQPSSRAFYVITSEDLQHVVVVELQEPEQAGAAVRLPDQVTELLIGGTGRQLGEQRREVRLADTGLDALQDYLKRPFAGEHMAAHGYVEDLFGCHRSP